MSVLEVIRSPFDIRDYQINTDINLPDEYVCPVLVPVKNQGSKPTCTAHAVASLVEYHYKRQHNGVYRTFSTEFIYGLREIGYYIGDGMRIRDALKTVNKYGVPFYHYCSGNNDCAEAMRHVNEKLDYLKELAYPHRSSAYYRCEGVDAIKTALVKHGPVIVSMNTYNNARIFDDIYTYEPTDTKRGCHCVMIYGYDSRGWLVQNSWGIPFAGDGRFVIPFSYEFNEAWGITDDIVNDDIKVKKRNWFMDIIYNVYNKLVNLWLDKTLKD